MTDHTLPRGTALRLMREALAEDLDGGVDVTSVATIPEAQRSTGRFVTRQAGTIAGLAVVLPGLVELLTDADIEPSLGDGARVVARRPAADGHRRRPATLLTLERTALNLLCHLSGIATLTSHWVDAVAGTGAQIRDTRKTTPGPAAGREVRRGAAAAAPTTACRCPTRR